MPTDPLTGSRYPASSAAPNVAQDIQNAVLDLSDNTVPNYATTGARDSAYAAWVALGNSMRNGLICTVADKPYIYSGGWRGLAKREAGGTSSVALNVNGDVVIAHGLGTTPTFETLTLVGTGGAAQYGKAYQYQASDATSLYVRVADTRDGSAMASFSVTIRWSAVVL